MPPAGPRPWTRAVGVGLVGMLGLTGCSLPGLGSGDRSSATSPTPTVSAPASDPAGKAEFARFYSQKPTWSACEETFECTTVTVPVDWNAPGGDTLQLAAIRLPAQGKRVGSLFLNPGGPGVSGVGWVRDAAEMYGRDLKRSFDLVGWDPRGIGKSSPIRCLPDAQMDTYNAVDATPDDAAELAALRASNERFSQGCEDRTGDVLGHVDTLSTVRDMDVLRAVVGDQTLTYFGASYGTFLGAWYAQTFPWRVGRLVLDGAVDPSSDAQQYAEGQAMGFDRALKAYVQDCLGQQTCPLRGTPAQAQSQLVRLMDESDGQPLRTDSGRQLTQSLLTTGIVQGMYSERLWPQLTVALTQGMQGNGTGLLELADMYNERESDGSFGQTLQATGPIYCLDHPEPRSVTTIAADAEKLGAKYPPLGEAIGWSALGCAEWPIKPVITPQKLTAEGAAPILVVGTTSDPATPYEWSQALAAQLSSGRLLTREGFGHTAYFEGSTCIDRAIEGYLLRGDVPKEGLVCS